MYYAIIGIKENRKQLIDINKNKDKMLSNKEYKEYSNIRLVKGLENIEKELNFSYTKQQLKFITEL
jgi:hypothetical protein